MTQINPEPIPPQAPLIDDRPHKAADDTEQVYFHGSPMLRFELMTGWPWVLFGLIVIAAPIVLRIMRPNLAIPWWTYLLALVVGVVMILIPWIKSKTVKYRISNYRIDLERGLLSTDIDTLELWHVEDISYHQSLLGRIFGVGTITIISHDDTTPKLELRGLPNPRPLFDSLKQRIIAVKRQRGVIKVDQGG
jgi:membrane protein YdbS with pleckstrin-like domain